MKRLFPDNSHIKNTGKNDKLVKLFTFVAFAVVFIVLLSYLFVSETLAKIVQGFDGGTHGSSAAAFVVDCDITGYDDEAFVCYNGLDEFENKQHYISYAIRNYSENGNVNGVLTRPVFSLTVPKRIFENVALQFVDSNGSPLTTQFRTDVITNPDITTFNTADIAANGKVAVPSAMEENVSITAVGNVITARGTLSGSRGTVIRITKFTDTIGYSVGFSRGVPLGVELYDESFANDMSATNLYCDCAESAELYRIDIDTPSIQLPPGVATELNVKLLFMPIGSAYGYNDTRYGQLYDKGTGDDDFVTKFSSSIVGTHYDATINAKKKPAAHISDVDGFSDGENANVTVRIAKTGGEYKFFVVAGTKRYALKERVGLSGVYDCENGYSYLFGNLEAYKNYKYRPDTDDADGYIAGVSMVISYKVIPEILFTQVKG